MHSNPDVAVLLNVFRGFVPEPKNPRSLTGQGWLILDISMKNIPSMVKRHEQAGVKTSLTIA